MNTDNMSILGLTIDYGPFSFLDDYDPDFTPNTTDLPGRRYAFSKQASIGYWNLGCLANAIAPLVTDQSKLIEAVESYEDIFWSKYYAMMGRKLGLDRVNENDIPLVDSFEKTLAALKPDMTIFYQLLGKMKIDLDSESAIMDHFEDSFYNQPTPSVRKELFDLMKAYSSRLKENTCSKEESQQLMKENNPSFILRNYLLHQAIEELERGETALFQKLQKAIKTPYSESNEEFLVKRPDWASQKAGCSMLSCSS